MTSILSKSKRLPILMAGALMLSLFSGCAAQVGSVAVNPDGSGVATAKVGLTEEGFTTLMETIGTGEEGGEAAESEPIDLSELESFTYNGVTYYGSTLTKSFSKAEEFNMDFSEVAPAGESEESAAVASYANDLEFGDMKLERSPSGQFTLTITTSPAAPEAEPGTPELAPADIGLTDEDVEEMRASMEAMAESMAQVLSFAMPADIEQMKGDTAGITIAGNELTIDYMKLNPDGDTYIFTCDASGSVVGPLPAVDEKENTFSDVLPGAWYYEVVEQMAQSGLVAGMPDGTFHPNDAITVDQFATILARCCGLPSGSASEGGYWGELGVRSCLAAGYINDRGVVNADNYGKAITREEAIIGLLKASNLTASTGDWTAEMIPDADAISEGNLPLIVAAYNAKLTNGVDDKHTFNPAGEMTRASICQDCVNLGWLSAAATPLDISHDFLYLLVDESEELSISNIPAEDAESEIVWTSSNPEVISVSEDGTVKALDSGSAIVTAYCGSLNTSCLVQAYELVDAHNGAVMPML